MTPISAIAMVGITPEEAGAASGLFNMMRKLGGAIGTAALRNASSSTPSSSTGMCHWSNRPLAIGSPICSNILCRTGSPTPQGRCTAP